MMLLSLLILMIYHYYCTADVTDMTDQFWHSSSVGDFHIDLLILVIY